MYFEKYSRSTNQGEGVAQLHFTHKKANSSVRNTQARNSCTCTCRPHIPRNRQRYFTIHYSRRSSSPPGTGLFEAAAKPQVADLARQGSAMPCCPKKMNNSTVHVQDKQQTARRHEQLSKFTNTLEKTGNCIHRMDTKLLWSSCWQTRPFKIHKLATWGRRLPREEIL